MLDRLENVAVSGNMLLINKNLSYAGKQPNGQFQLPRYDKCCKTSFQVLQWKREEYNRWQLPHFSTTSELFISKLSHLISHFIVSKFNQNQIVVTPNLFLDQTIRAKTMFAYIIHIKARWKHFDGIHTHDNDEIDMKSGDEHNPSVKTFYNLIKILVDVVNTEYSVTMVGNRSPLTPFC